MEQKNYEVSVKRWGWTTMSFSRFIRKYYTIEQRIKIISNPKKCSVSHVFENRELSLEETLLLFANYDYSLCEKNYYDLEQYLHYYNDIDNESVRKAKVELEALLFNSPTKTRLRNYVIDFPKGIYSKEAKTFLENNKA